MTGPVTGPATGPDEHPLDAPGAARRAYRRLRTAAGVAPLPDLEDRLERLEVGVREEGPLLEGLERVLDDVEASLVPLLERRARRIEQLRASGTGE